MHIVMRIKFDALSDTMYENNHFDNDYCYQNITFELLIYINKRSRTKIETPCFGR